MVKRRPMSTARGVAVVRAAEMLRREPIARDPYAKSFVLPLNAHGLGFIQRLGISRLIGIEPMITFAIVREQFVHDLILAEAKTGLDQLVILGAGFDTRAYRIPELAGVAVYEVDHPVTQQQKREALEKIEGAVPLDVHFVGVDFEVDDLGERLRAAGYREDKRTLFVWQGVSMYLTDAGVDRTLAFVAMHSAPGSVIVFDYFDAQALRSSEAAVIRFFTSVMGEHVSWALDPKQLTPFLETRGYTAVRNIDAAAMARPHLTGTNADRPMARGVNIAIATVA
jgi:methyltransferase (TIGR00027 family)